MVMTTKQQDEMIAKVTRKLMDEGKLIEAGWTSLRIMSISSGASELQLDEMRNAFFAGAQHLFGSIMGGLDPGVEPTEADEHRLDLIAKELSDFLKIYKQKHFPNMKG